MCWCAWWLNQFLVGFSLCVCELLCWERATAWSFVRFPCARTGSNFHFISAASRPLRAHHAWLSRLRGGIGRSSPAYFIALLRRYGQFSKSTFRMIIWNSNCHPSSVRSPFDCCCGDSMAQNRLLLYSGEMKLQHFENLRATFTSNFLNTHKVIVNVLPRTV